MTSSPTSKSPFAALAFLAVAASFALSGCATPPGAAFTDAKAAAADKTSVYIYRRDRLFAAAMSFPVEVDAKPVGALYNASFLNLNLEPGKHTITVKPGGFAKDFSLDTQALPGSTQFVEFDLNGGLLANMFFIGSELLERPQDKALADLKLLKSAK